MGTTVAAIILLIFVFVIIPMAAFRTIRKIKRGGNRPLVPGRDCRACGGWGQVPGPTVRSGAKSAEADAPGETLSSRRQRSAKTL